MFCLGITEKRDRQYQVRPLQVNDQTKNAYYMLIKNLSCLIRTQYYKYQYSHFFCQYCLLDCISQEVLQNHEDICKQQI